MNGSYTNQLIQQTNAVQYAKERAVPFVVWDEDISNLVPVSLPSLPEGATGWRLLKTDRVASTTRIPRRGITSQAHFKSNLVTGNGYAIIGSGPDYHLIGQFTRDRSIN